MKEFRVDLSRLTEEEKDAIRNARLAGPILPVTHVPTLSYDRPGLIRRLWWRCFGWRTWRNARGLWWWEKR